MKKKRLLIILYILIYNNCSWAQTLTNYSTDNPPNQIKNFNITSFGQSGSDPSNYIISWTVDQNTEITDGVASYNIISDKSGQDAILGNKPFFVPISNANNVNNNYSMNIKLTSCSKYQIHIDALDQNKNVLSASLNYVSAFQTSDFDRSQASILQFNLNYSTSGATQNFNWIANQIKLNPGFSFSPSGSNFVQFTGTNIYTCSTITNRSDSLPQKLILNESINNSSTPNISNLQIYPNPTNDKITIDIPNVAANTTVSIINFVGQTIYSAAITTSTTIVDLSTYNSGVYLVKINSAEISKAIKLIKN